MSFFTKLLSSIGIKRTAQVPAPTNVAPPMQPVQQPATGLPFNANQGNQQQDAIRRQNRMNDMVSWLNRNLAHTRDDTDLELALDRDGKGDWIDDPLFFEAINQTQSMPAMNAPMIEQYPDMSVDEIEQFARAQSSDTVLPPQITENPNNMALYEQVVQGLMGQGEFGEEEWKQDTGNVAGVSSEELADIFYNNYLNVSDEHENPEESPAYSRFMQLNSKFPDLDIMDVLKTRVFRGLPNGYDAMGEQKEDFRIKFFLENASWLGQMGLLPGSVQQMIDGGTLGRGKETYEGLYQDIDTVSNTLASILSYDDPQVQERVWDWVSSKLGSQAMQDKYRARQNAVDEDGGEFQHSEDARLNQLREEPSEPELSQEQRATIMDAYKGDLQAMGQTLRMLGSDVRGFITNELAKRNPRYAPGNEWYSKTLASEFWPDQAATIIDSLVNSDAFSDPKKLKELERKGKANFTVDEGGRVVMRPSQGNTWESIDFSKMLPLDQKISIWVDGMLDDASDLDPDSYRAGLRDINQLGKTKIDRARMQTDPGYRAEVEEGLRKSKRLHAQMDQILGDIGEFLTSDEITEKYPKNVVMSYLDLITVYSKIRKAGELLSEKSEKGQQARRDLAMQKAEEGALGQYTPEMVAKMDDSNLRQIADAVIQEEVNKSKVSRKAKEYYGRILDRDDGRFANFSRQIALMKQAVSRTYALNKLASSMAKFASIDTIRSMKNAIRREFRERLASL